MKPKLKQAKEWIEHAKSENSVHVSVPVDVMEQLIAEVSRAHELPSIRTVEACMAENRLHGHSEKFEHCGEIFCLEARELSGLVLARFAQAAVRSRECVNLTLID